MPHARAAREGGRLAVDRAARRLEVLFQLLVFAPQALTFRLRPAEVLPQTLVLSTQLLDCLLGVARRGIRWVSDRTCMPDPSPIEKYKELMATI
jgi:hypothetical protein